MDQLQQAFLLGISLAVQWLGLCASTAGGLGSIPGQGTEVPQVSVQGKKKKKEIKNKTKKQASLLNASLSQQPIAGPRSLSHC